MDTGSDRSGNGGRLLLLGDAFLFAAALDIVLSSAFMAIAASTGFADNDISTTSVLAIAIQGTFMLSTVLVVGGGTLFAWRMHGRKTDLKVIVAMVVGVVVGTSIALPLFGGLAFLLSRIPIGGRQDQPPWLAIGVLAAFVIGFLAIPVVDAIRDMAAAERHHLRLDQLRLAALAVVVALAGIVLPALSAVTKSEVAEAGIFMVPFAAGAIFAALGADLYSNYRDKRLSQQPAPQV